jgi:hypothetical protein
MWPPLQPGFGGHRLSRILENPGRLLQSGNRVAPSIQYGLMVRRMATSVEPSNTSQTTEFALRPLFGNEFDPAVAGVAFGEVTSDFFIFQICAYGGTDQAGSAAGRPRPGAGRPATLSGAAGLSRRRSRISN